jgi:phenylpropionate dioxygenase-like ring-hydroxylating dioxygenase large terminal subunit
MADKLGRERTRNWLAEVYTDSAPENWRDILDETHLEWVEGPLHDKDVNPDGSTKKPHWHIILLFPSVQTFEQVKQITDSVHGPIPLPCKTVKGSIRYMVHKDHPDKFQYDWGDIKCHGGADLNDLCAPTHTERLQIQQDILTFSRESGIVEFSDLVNHCIDEGLHEWLNILLNFSTLSITAYLRSARHKADIRKPLAIDPETGEVIAQ